MSRGLDFHRSPSSSSSSSPGLPQKLLLLLLLLLLHVSAQRAQAAPPGARLATELRCQCVKTTQGIHYSNMAKVEVIPAGPYCANIEVIVTLKNGKNVCLNPEAPRVKKLIEKMLNGKEGKD
ncbi:permeability factor 2-like [Tachyglossus aculeatus]|uniref:permeability factor 2-like n=1 Tax=Tachyglossus aculeatus TaxID=9261 RepID=UPI0018F2F40C|nr:permeability factor 2-like [Tachyglossus aculeatus]